MSEADDKVDNFIGEKNDGQAVRWFGLYSMAMSVGTMFFWMFFNDKTYIAANRAWFYAQIEFFLPVFISWLFVSFFDSETMRSIFSLVVTISILGPFASHWYHNATFFLGCEGVCLDSITFYIYLAAYSAFTFFQMIIDVLLLPQIYDWSDDARILDNGASTLLAMF